MSKAKNNENTKEKKYTKRAILLNYKGVKKDILKTLLNDNKIYSLNDAEIIYKKFIEGGK